MTSNLRNKPRPLRGVQNSHRHLIPRLFSDDDCGTGLTEALELSRLICSKQKHAV
jgi:hypothetical protein